MVSPVLLAGFGSFPGAPVNPAAGMAERLAQADIADIAACVLPVEWEGSWPALERAILDAGASRVLLVGLHQRIERVRVETMARNRRELGRCDAAGGFPSGPSVLEGPERIPCRLSWATVAHALRGAGIDFEWSRDAGSYLCNDTLYRLAFHARRLGVERFGFLHIPLSDEAIGPALEADAVPPVCCSLPEATLDRVARAMIEACQK